MKNANWLDSDYVNQLMMFAKIMAKSRTINIGFRNDEATCFMICHQAYRWGLDPDFVAANSYFDDYGRLSQLGKVLKSALENNPSVESIVEEYKGDWDLVKNNFKMNNERVPVPLWSVEVESGLSLTVTVKLTDGTKIVESATLGMIDPVLRSYNECWITRPYFQISNHVIRQIAYGKLAHLVNGSESSEAEIAQKEVTIRQAAKSASSDGADTTTLPQQTVAVDSEEAKECNQLSQYSAKTEYLLAEADKVEQSLTNDFVDTQTKEDNVANWVESVQSAKSELSTSEQDLLSKRYSSMFNQLSTVEHAT